MNLLIISLAACITIAYFALKDYWQTKYKMKQEMEGFDSSGKFHQYMLDELKKECSVRGVDEKNKQEIKTKISAIIQAVYDDKPSRYGYPIFQFHSLPRKTKLIISQRMVDYYKVGVDTLSLEKEYFTAEDDKKFEYLSRSYSPELILNECSYWITQLQFLQKEKENK